MILEIFFLRVCIVTVPPKWHIEPSNANVAAGQDVVIDCQAVGSPDPSIMWRKSIG